MDIVKVLSIEGFVDYYLGYCKRIDEVSKEERKFKRAGKRYESKELLNLMRELQFVEKRYSLMCSVRELQEALRKYPEGSLEHSAVELINVKKDAMINSINRCINL